MSLSNRSASLLLCLLVALFAPLSVHAAPKAPPKAPPKASKAPPPSPVAVELAVQRVVPDGKGGETLESADRAVPGDVIAYAVVYRNQGKNPARAVKGTLPVPPGTEYLPGTADPAGIEASLDGTAFSPVPIRRTVKKADGTEEVKEVPPSEYRSLRWDLKTLSPGQAVTVRARMKIQDFRK